VEGWTKRRTRPCMLPGICEQQRQLALHTSSTHIHARRATATGEQQQPWKVTLAQTRHTSIAPLQPAAPGPTFALWQGRRRELTSASGSLPIDTGEEPFARTGGTSGSSHTYSPRESCAYARRVSLFVVCQLLYQHSSPAVSALHRCPAPASRPLALHFAS
jgi:hypothetical protein